MLYLSITNTTATALAPKIFRSFALVFCLVVLCASAFAHPEISTSDDDTTVIVQNAPEQEVYVFGKAVIVKKQAKGVLAIGGDVTVEGRVEGDVATIGGNVIQEEGGYIGGDVIVFGGSYKPKSQMPLREPGKETVMFGVLEDEIKDMAQNPSQIFSPSWSWSFVAQRIVVALLWFVISLAMTTVAPGAVSRAVARIQLSSLKICGIGAGAFMFASILIVTGALTLPTFLSATVGAMGLLLLLLGYVFGRVALQVSAGKLLQKYLFPENNRSETLATLTGVLVWTLLLSLPYVWVFALFSVFAFGIGLILTARSARVRQIA